MLNLKLMLWFYYWLLFNVLSLLFKNVFSSVLEYCENYIDKKYHNYYYYYYLFC